MTEPLLLIPGLACDADIWADVAEGLVMQSAATSIAAMAADILARSPQRFALAGHSMGGYIALEMIAQAPQRVTRLALLATSARADGNTQRERREAAIAGAKTDFARVITSLATATLAPHNAANPALRDRALAMMLRCGGEAFLRQSTAVLARCDHRATLSGITVPTLVLCGDADIIIPPAASRELAEMIPGAELVMLPGCGHMVQLEEPAAASAALTRWLTA